MTGRIIGWGCRWWRKAWAKAVSGGAVYLILSVLGLPENIVLFLSIASGPIIGTVIVAVYVMSRARRATLDEVERLHETTSGDPS
jgi:hypothetical protein